MVDGLTFREKIAAVGLRMLPIRSGKHRILDHILPILGSPPEGLRQVPWPSGSILIDGSDFVGRRFLILRTFDPEVVDVLAFFIGDESEAVVWDVGANMGTFSYQFAARFPKCRIVAIEPQTDLAELIQGNLGVVHPGMFEVFDVGIGPEEDEMLLEVPDGMRGSATLVPELLPDLPHSAVRVKIVPADWIVEHSRFGWPTVMKLDIQGYESIAIESARDAFHSGSVRAAVFEFMSDVDSTASWEKIGYDVTLAGYGIFAILRDSFRTWIEPAGEPVSRAKDYVAVRRDLVPTGTRRISIPRG